VDKHDDDAGSRYAKLEQRLTEFIEKFDAMNTEMTAIKEQQIELLEFIKQNLKK
jgi:hypothetical protein